MRASFRLGSIGGIEVGIHYTWFFALILISWTLSEGLYASAFEQWTPATR